VLSFLCRKKENEMTNYKVELISTSDPYTDLKSGDVGKLVSTGIDPFDGGKIVSVRWENGSTLSLIEGQDYWRVYEDKLDK
jgi:hypothetical protein